MRQRYLVRIWLTGPLATPMHSGTIFGHLCWAYRYCHGETALEGWLERISGDPLLISDALPRGYFPRPLLKPAVRTQPLGGKELTEFKQLRKRPWLSRESFLKYRSRLSETTLFMALREDADREKQLEQRIEPVRARAAHNTIQRHSGRTPERGGLYFTDELWPPGARLEREILVESSLEPRELRDLFEVTGKWGFGRDASTGRGRFDVESIEPAPGEWFMDGGNRCLTLSHGSITPNMRDCRYRLHVHYGRSGSLYSIGARPFKYPMTLIEPGATFAPADGGPFGALLENVHSAYPQVRHSAWHFVLPFNEPEETDA
ncbi:MAG: type III-A CRISPR-associated RAMP protein Csm4 [Bryobacteraceae bacterium]